jgi:hypothetical protein
MKRIILPPVEPTLEERSRLLAQAIDSHVGWGYRVIEQSATTAKLTKRLKPDHAFNGVMTVTTFGWWLPVWFFETVFPKVFMSRTVVSLEIDRYGNFIHSRRGSIGILVDRLRALRLACRHD